jgi:hypothetical protein
VPAGHHLPGALSVCVEFPGAAVRLPTGAGERGPSVLVATVAELGAPQSRHTRLLVGAAFGRSAADPQRVL